MTGVFKKKKPTSADYIKFFHTATVPQLNILHEVSSQHLQHPPSASWGYQKLPFVIQGEPAAWSYLREATRQPVHEFARRMTDNTDISKKASGIVSNVVTVLKDGAKYAIKYGVKAAAALIKHKDAIITGVKFAKNAADLASSIAAMTGVITPETHKKVTAVTSAISGAADKYKTKPKKTGGNWIDAEELLLPKSYTPFEPRAIKNIA